MLCAKKLKGRARPLWWLSMTSNSNFSFGDAPDVRRLAEAFGGELPQEEQVIWITLSDEHRTQAFRRIRAINRWQREEPGYAAKQAAEDAGLSLSRFYRVAREWEDSENRSLARLGLGTVRTGPRRKRSRSKASRLAFDRAGELVSADPKDEKSVTQLIEELTAALSSEIEAMPGSASLRSTIVEARRRRDTKDEVGVDLALDVSAIAMRTEHDDLYRVGVCIDRGTGMILGAAIVETANARESYAPVAADALEMIASNSSDGIPWSSQFQRCEFVLLADEDAAWQKDLSKACHGLNLQPSDRSGRFGRYIRQHVGDGIGKLRLLPTLTLSGTAAETSAPKRRYSDREAAARLGIEVAAHNDRILSRLKRSTVPLPPSLRRFLEYVAGG